MAIKTIEDDIKSKLESSISDLKIDSFPDKGDYQLMHPKGAVLVDYSGTKYAEPELTEFIQQTVIYNFSTTLIVKGLRDKDGAYSHIDSIISALTGYKPTDCVTMYPTSVDFYGEESGIFRYDISFDVLSENYSI